ncbi:MAG TPA: universal stress protein [Solirubrobacter sp.]|nr:universal stress protein [Solirubrobacter sp.]
MNTIVIGVDASERAEDAIAFGRLLTDATAAQFVVASAFGSTEYAPMRDVALDTAGALKERLGTPRAHVRVLADPSPAQALQRLAHSERAALLVVGSSHVGRYGRVWPGSTAERLLHGAPCAVAVVPSGYRDRAQTPLRRVGVAYDGSASAQAALAAGAAIAHATGAGLEIIGVVESEGYVAPALIGIPAVAVAREDLERHVQDQLDAALDGLAGGIDATAVRLAGDPAERLGEHSGRLDVLICGSRGRGPLRSVLLGGVSGRLVRTARCPLIVVPNGVEDPLGGLFGAVRPRSASSASR